MLHRNRALHGLLIALAIWLPVGQALALCCMTMPHPAAPVAAEPADSAQADAAMPCHGQAAAASSHAPTSVAGEYGAENAAGHAVDGHEATDCSDGDCHHSCHAGAILRTHFLAQAQSLSAESPRVAQPAIHTAHLRRLLRPPIITA